MLLCFEKQVVCLSNDELIHFVKFNNVDKGVEISRSGHPSLVKCDRLFLETLCA